MRCRKAGQHVMVAITHPAGQVAELTWRFSRVVESEPSNLFADTIAPVRRTLPSEIFFVRIEATPEAGCEDYGSAGGAFVNCYIDADDLRTAEIRAIGLIQQHGWQPIRFDTWEVTCAECVDDTSPEDGGSSPRELVEQARLDGEVCVFHCWPIDAPDAGDRNA